MKISQSKVSNKALTLEDFYQLNANFSINWDGPSHESDLGSLSVNNISQELLKQLS